MLEFIFDFFCLGAIFHKGDEDREAAFLKAISETRHELHAPAFTLDASCKHIVSDTDSFTTAKTGK